WRPRRTANLQPADARLPGRLSERDRQRGVDRHLAVQAVGQREPEVDPAVPGLLLAVGIASPSRGCRGCRGAWCATPVRAGLQISTPKLAMTNRPLASRARQAS